MRIETGESNPVLRAVCAPVDPSEIRRWKKFAAELVDFVENPDNGACGLAAPQAGKEVRIVAVSLMKTWEDENYQTVAMLNPEIVSAGKESETDVEGCLSLPGARGLVSRPREARVRWLDPSGNRHERSFSGAAARIVQHEMDHLDGVLFTDKALPVPPAEPHPR